MILRDLHVHTTFCDGKSTPEEIVLAAIEKGMTTLGFSGHSHTAFDKSWCMSVSGTAAYRREVARLREKYRGQIEILCGVEQDYFSDASTEGYDYVIGSVHYVRIGEEYIPIDESPELLARFDPYELAARYYALVGDVVEKTGCQIIGHFDLITKFQEVCSRFDEADPRYVRAWQAAAERLIPTGAAFEINTGAISRGYRTSPYPALPILSYLKAHGARLLLSSDSHHRDTLLYGFEEWEKLLY
ncbi:MAG: histidinol-phosphatase [bacterium]